MKLITTNTTAVILIVASGFLIASKPINHQKDNQPNGEAGAKSEQQDNPYHGLRNLRLSMTADQLGFEKNNKKNSVYGIIMDWDLGNGIVTLTAFKTGEASIYFSNGGGILGGGQDEKVRTAVLQYVDKGQDYLTKMENQLQPLCLIKVACAFIS